MKNKQFVEYSDKEKRFKIDQLLYLDVDSQSRAELIDLFGIFSDNPMYKILSRRSTTLYLLGGILVLLLLCFATLYIQWYVPTKSPNAPIVTRRLLLGGHPRRLAENDTILGSLGLGNGDFNDPDDDFISGLDFPENASASPISGNETDVPSTAVTNSTGTANTTDTQTGTQTGTNTSAIPGTTSADTNPQTNQGTLNNTQTDTTVRTNHTTTTNTTDTSLDDDEDGYTDIDLQNEYAATSYSFFYFLLVIIGILVLSLAVLECRKRQIYRNLQVFEETTLKTFHNKVNNRIIISTCHEQMVLLGLYLFSIYSFRFLVHNNGTEIESMNLSSGSMQNAPISQPLEAQFGSENSIYKVIDEEGEKYHNAVINLNKQLQNTQ
jgi:hypothetical protein